MLRAGRAGGGSTDLARPADDEPAIGADALGRSFHAAPVGLALVDPAGRVRSPNRALRLLLGARDDEVVALALQDAVAALGVGERAARCYLRPDGTCVWLRLLATPVDQPPVDGTAEWLVLAAEDLTEHRRGEQALAHRATHDPLTGLPNRSLFLDRLDIALARCRRSHRHVAVLFCDLDGFKAVNDHFGHAAGDEVLCTLALRLRSTLRPDDTVARLGGDEFAVVSSDLAAVEEADAIVARLAAAVTEPVALGSEAATVGVSIGLATSTGDHDPADLLAAADRAMYTAKGARR